MNIYKSDDVCVCMYLQIGNENEWSVALVVHHVDKWILKLTV